jgi:hypothetical protein
VIPLDKEKPRPFEPGFVRLVIAGSNVASSAQANCSAHNAFEGFACEFNDRFLFSQINVAQDEVLVVRINRERVACFDTFGSVGAGYDLHVLFLSW